MKVNGSNPAPSRSRRPRSRKASRRETSTGSRKKAAAGPLHRQWAVFERELKTEARYFSPRAAATLAAIFDSLDGLATKGGRKAVVTAGPGEAFDAVFRARIFQSDPAMERALQSPDQEMGSPPAASATAARMNAQGVSVFYGSLDAETALAETRPPVGSRVMVARFAIIRPVRLLDLEALRHVDAAACRTKRMAGLKSGERARFLERLSQRLTLPVMPDDEPFQYLPTQVVADYLANQGQPPLDGMIYRSAQNHDAGANIVLFHKAARVQPLKGQSRRSSKRHGDAGAARRADGGEAPATQQPLIGVSLEDASADEREPALSLDRTSLVIHRITSVAYETEKEHAHRRRRKARKLSRSRSVPKRP